MSPRWREAAVLLAFGVAFLVAHQVGLDFITPSNPVSPVWPPAGVLLGAFLLLPRHLWPGAIGVVIAADCASNLLAGVRLAVGLAYLLASLVELAVALALMRRLVGYDVSFRRIRDTLALLAAATAGPVLSAFLAAAIAAATSDASYVQSALTWWTADALGILLFTPLIVAWMRGIPSLREIPWRMATEGVLFLAVWSWSAWRIFRGDLTIGWVRPHPYMLASALVWAAFRLGIRGVTLALASLATIAVFVVHTGVELFPLGGDDVAERLLLVQVFLGVLAVTGLLLAAALAEGRAATAAARENAGRLRALGDNLPRGVVHQVVRELDGSMHVEHVSAAVERVTGLTVAEVMRDPSARYGRIPAAEAARVAAAEELSARTQSVFAVETPILHPSGEERWTMISSTPRRLEDGRTVWDGIQLDITERRRDELRLRAANRALRTLGSCHQVLGRAGSEEELLRDICRVIVDEGGFRLAWVGFAGDDAEQRVRPVAHAGYEGGYLDGLDVRWSDTPAGRGPTGLAIRTGRPVAVHDVLTDPSVAPWRTDAVARGYRSSVVLPLRSGARVFGALSVYAADPAAFDDEEIDLLSELADDVAFGLMALRAREEHARAEEALAASEERFRQLAENIREIFWMVDARSSRLLYISPGVERQYGVTAEQLMEAPELGLERVHPEDRDRVLAASAAVATGGEYDEEYRVVHVNGTVSWVHARAFPVRNAAGEVYRVVGISDDVTARKRMEEQLRQVQKLEAIGQLAGGVAHDFNNILAAVMMQASMARATPGVGADVAELLQDIQASAQRAANLTRQLLLFSRKQTMQARRVELNELVSDLVRMLRRVVPEHVELQLAMHPRRLVVQADPGMLEQVVMNLTVNARDAMPSGGTLRIETFARTLGAEEVRAFSGAAPGRYTGVRVRDSGTGIPPQHRPRIFEPFFTTKEPGKGTGLGLATVFGIVQQHRGVIFVESEVGRGTAVDVLLPAEDDAGSSVAEVPGAAADRADGRQTILVVEDDPAVRTLTRRVLEGHGYTVHVARTGREALDEWEGYAPRVDLLLTDMVMPDGVGGAALARALQERAPSLRVVFSSGYDPAFDQHEVRLEPGVNFLQKPSTPRQLLAVVSQALREV